MAGRVEIVLTEEFRKRFRKLPDGIKKKVRKQLGFLATNPGHPSLKMHKLNDEWDFYVDIHYRCIFHRMGDKFLLLTVGTHRIVDRYRRK